MSLPTAKEGQPPLIVIVSGGGPVGLTFSLHLTMMMGKHVKIIIYEGRWFVDGQGRTRWQGEEQGKTRRDQVVTLQDHVIQQMPAYIQKGLFEQINECVWPTSRNIPIQEVEDRLFDLIQPFVENGQIELIPENFDENSEPLIKGSFDILVGADGAGSFVRSYCKIDMVTEGTEYACGVAYKIPKEVPPQDEPLHQALNCILTVSQTRYLVNSSTSRRGYLNIRLTKDEYDELSARTEKFKLRKESLDLSDYNKCPKSPVWTIIRQGLDYFQILSKYVFRVVPIQINVRHASVVVRELRFEIPKIGQHRKDLDEKEYKTALAFLAGDAAMNVHFWPGRGMNSGMKGAMSLARNILRSCTSKNGIHIRTPLRFLDFLDYEGFMARLRAREQQGRSFRILTNPIDQYIDAASPYGNVNFGYQKYIKKLIDKLQETRTRLQDRPEWPHKSKPITDDELKSASNRISPEAVAQLSLANPWPTREMGGIEVLVEDTYPFDPKNFLRIPLTVPTTTTRTNLERLKTVIIRHRFIILWIIGEKKDENMKKLVENIQKSEKFSKTSTNSEGLHQLTVVHTIKEATDWIKSNRESIRQPDIRFKVVTLWTMNDNQTAIDVIRAVRSEVPRAPILVFTNKHEENQPAFEIPNVMETDAEVELKEFIGINREAQWNAGCPISHTQKSSLVKDNRHNLEARSSEPPSLPYPSSDSPSFTREPSVKDKQHQLHAESSGASSLPYPSLDSPLFTKEPLLPSSANSDYSPNSTRASSIRNSDFSPNRTRPSSTRNSHSPNSSRAGSVFNFQNPSSPRRSPLKPMLLWIDSNQNDSDTKDIRKNHPTLEIHFQPTYQDAEKYFQQHLHEINQREKFIVICRGNYKEEKKCYTDVAQLLIDLNLGTIPLGVYTSDRTSLLSKTRNPPETAEIFDKRLGLHAFVNRHLTK